jgi:excisionase family DNA binding protein
VASNLDGKHLDGPEQARDEFLTLAEFGQVTNTSTRFARRLVAERRIRFVRFGRHIRIPLSALAEFVDLGTVKPESANQEATEEMD